VRAVVQTTPVTVRAQVLAVDQAPAPVTPAKVARSNHDVQTIINPSPLLQYITTLFIINQNHYSNIMLIKSMPL